MEVHILAHLCQSLTAVEEQDPYCTPEKSRATFEAEFVKTKSHECQREGRTLMTRSLMTGALSFTSSNWMTRVPVPVAGTSSGRATATNQHGEGRVGKKQR